MRVRSRFLAVCCLCLLGLAPPTGAQGYRGVGVSGFLDYNLPLLSLRDGWYTKSVKWGAALLYSVDSRLTMEFEYHRAKYNDGKIEGRTFLWSVDQKEYASPGASADMRINSAVINFLVRMGRPSGLFQARRSSLYLLVGAGFFDYDNRVRGLIYPGQTATPLNPARLLEPDRDRRTALGVNLGLGLERFLTRVVALDFRARHNFILGQLKPREAWRVKEAWPLQTVDLGVAVKFYKSASR